MRHAVLLVVTAGVLYLGGARGFDTATLNGAITKTDASTHIFSQGFTPHGDRVLRYR